MKIQYLNAFYAWLNFKEETQKIIKERRYSQIAEIGGGANPLLTKEFIQENKLTYHVIDISEEELAKADVGYKTFVMDLEASTITHTYKYDFIFSQLTVEHIANIETFYSNIFELLKPGGTAWFFFACKTTLPTFLNNILPESVSKKILLFVQPFRKHEKHGKFKAHYKWCLGPTQKNLLRFEGLDFEVISYTGYFGHSYYERIPIIRNLEKLKTKLLLKYPLPSLCSYSHVLLKRPD
jgi:2-polyprenyl-3-methyl-5-hydroxy-6-metoxy-1,4-benzoquinol methylase